MLWVLVIEAISWPSKESGFGVGLRTSHPEPRHGAFLILVPKRPRAQDDLKLKVSWILFSVGVASHLWDPRLHVVFWGPDFCGAAVIVWDAAVASSFLLESGPFRLT